MTKEQEDSMMDNPRPAQSYAPNMQRHDCIGAMMPNPESGDWVSFYAANKQINEANSLLRAVLDHIAPAMSTPSPVAPVAPESNTAIHAEYVRIRQGKHEGYRFGSDRIANANSFAFHNAAALVDFTSNGEFHPDTDEAVRAQARERLGIQCCPGAGRVQAFRLGSAIIGYGQTPEAATANLLEREAK